MESYMDALKAYELAQSQVQLPCTAANLKLFGTETFKKLNIAEDVIADFMRMLSQQNFQAANTEFIRMMKMQLILWKPIFGNEMRITVCLSQFREEEYKLFGVTKEFVTRAIEFFDEEKVPNKATLVTRFIVHLGQAFMMAGDYYLARYELSDEWRRQNKVVVNQMSDTLADCYRKYCYFYHPKIQEEIRHKMKQLPSISHMLDQFRKKLHTTTHLLDSNMRSILSGENANERTVKFVNNYNLISDKAFENRRPIFKALYEEFKGYEDYFGFLKEPGQKEALEYILLNVLETIELSERQKQDIMNLLKHKSMGLKLTGKYVSVNQIDWLEPDIQRTLVYLFVGLTRNGYTSWIRQYLRFVYRRLADLRYRYSNFSVLILLENRRIAHSDLLDTLRNSVQVVGQPIKVLLERIKETKKLKEPVPFMTFQKIGKRFRHSRVLTIFISGFTCQNNARQENWKVLLHNGQTYAMNWECGSKSNPFTFLFGFEKTRQIAVETGKYLAHLIREHMKGYLINLVGFSLGTELVRNVLLNMEEDIGMINRLIFLGGVANCRDLANFLTDHPIDTINCYNAGDLVLKMMLPVFDSSLRPCGLNFLQAPFTKNIDTKDFAKPLGHNIVFGELRKVVEFEHDVLYYEEQSAT